MTYLLNTLLLTSTALTAPTTRQAIAANTATCALSQNYASDGSGQAFWAYDVHIGRPFINGAGCEPVHQTIDDASPVGGWSCTDDGTGNTQLKFAGGVTTDRTKNLAINHALGVAYPMIPFDGEKICIVPGAEDG